MRRSVQNAKTKRLSLIPFGKELRLRGFSSDGLIKLIFKMSTYNHLTVYKTSYDLMLEIFKLTKSFSREYKYSIGQDLKREVTLLIKRIFQANSSFDTRVEYIKKARGHIEVIRLYIRALKDLQEINVKKFARISVYIESVSRQLTGWQRSCKG